MVEQGLLTELSLVRVQQGEPQSLTTNSVVRLFSYQKLTIKYQIGTVLFTLKLWRVMTKNHYTPFFMPIFRKKKGNLICLNILLIRTLKNK